MREVPLQTVIRECLPKQGLPLYPVQGKPFKRYSFDVVDCFDAVDIRRGRSTSQTLPMSSEYGTYRTVKARFWPWLSGTSPYNILKVFPLRSDAEGTFVPDTQNRTLPRQGPPPYTPLPLLDVKATP